MKPTTAMLACILLHEPIRAQPAHSAEARAAFDAFARIGAVYGFTERPGDGLRYLFYLPATFTDDHVAGLPNLEIPYTISLRDAPITDTGVRALGKIKNLEGLHLYGLLVSHECLKDLKNLTILHLDRIDTPPAALRELQGFKNLVELGVVSKKLSDADVKEIAKINTLRSLKLAGPLVTDAGLKEVARMKNLRELELGGTSVTDAGMKELAAMPNLTRLNLYQTKVTDKGLANLRGLKKLTLVARPLDLVTDDTVRTLAEAELLHALGLCRTESNKRPTSAEEVHTLSLAGTKVTADGLREFRALKKLAVLNLAFTNAADAWLKDVSAFESLTTLELRKTAVSDAGMAEVGLLKNLTTLDLRDTKITANGLRKLKGLRRLTTLYLNEKSITDDVVHALREGDLLHALAADKDRRPTGPGEVLTVSFRGTKITDKAINDLKVFKNLESLDLTGVPITDGTLQDVKHFSRLKALFLGKATIGANGLTVLKTCKDLTTLGLTDITLDVAGYKAIRELEGLTTLYLDHPRNPGLMELKDHPHLTELRFTEYINFAKVGKGLSEFKNLTTLQLGNGPVLPAELVNLKGLKKLTTLQLHPFSVDDATLRSLREAELLHALHLAAAADNKRPHNSQEVVALKLRLERISAAGLKELKEFSNLASLDLMGTQVNDAGLKELKDFKRLTLLDLTSTPITDAGLPELKECKALTRLHLSSVKLTNEKVDELRRQMPKCTIIGPGIRQPSAYYVDFGRYRKKEDKNPANALGHVELTRKIPCAIGETFGYRIRFNNLPSTRGFTVKSVLTHPPIKQPDGTLITQSVLLARADMLDFKFVANQRPTPNKRGHIPTTMEWARKLSRDDIAVLAGKAPYSEKVPNVDEGFTQADLKDPQRAEAIYKVIRGRLAKCEKERPFGYLVREAPAGDVKDLQQLAGHLAEGSFITKFRKTFARDEMNDDLAIVPARHNGADDSSEYEELLPVSPP